MTESADKKGKRPKAQGPAEDETRYSLDMPRDLHERLQLAAKLDGSNSMRDFILKVLRRRLERDAPELAAMLEAQRRIAEKDSAPPTADEQSEHHRPPPRRPARSRRSR